MSQPAAKQGDRIVAVDIHVVMIPSPGGPVPTPVPSPFSGALVEGLSEDVLVEDLSVAVEGSKAHNQPPHTPAGGPFQKPPTNEGRVQRGSATVFANDKSMARAGDPAITCNDPADAPNGSVIASSRVLVG